MRWRIMKRPVDFGDRNRESGTGRGDADQY
jgi:hypothetical protein